MLFFAHCGEGAKNNSDEKTKDAVSVSDKKVTVSFPAGIEEKLIDGGIFQHTFNFKIKYVTPEMIRDAFTLELFLIIFNEVSVILSNFIFMMDEKLS